MLENNMLLVGTTHIRFFFIYQTAIYEQNMKEINLSTLPRNQDFSRFFFRTAAICRAGNKQVNEIKTATKEKTRRKKKHWKNGFSEGPNSS